MQLLSVILHVSTVTRLKNPRLELDRLAAMKAFPGIKWSYEMDGNEMDGRGGEL